ncbi:thiaminase II [Allonocardiopsis opalescens]|uniref:Aminopyrimidine aminohydrolase n=1 Tax=Allonocardiopsis opalescens TaxID=1144618 RepID=A0A2T0Q6M3_9ACTN|nr:thiaminase II [Allonocardiopsis opalescens]PRX99477.1 thiaminase/transcriptional activator TenA [Allonocardiopsis opalescens]
MTSASTETTFGAEPGEAGFTAGLGKRHAHLFEEFWEHPFLAGLRDGTLAKEKVLHYVGQDNQYLTAYLRCYGLGMALSPDRRWMRHFHDSAAFILDDETHPHHVMCDYAGVAYEDAQVERLAPTAQAYINHMMAAGRDSLGVLLAALLPCPWTYTWAGARFLAEARPGPEHPFYGWWEFYGTRATGGVTDRLRVLVDGLAEDAGAAERARMERAFEDSCHYEIRFWEMAWTLEDWPLRPRPA